MAILLGRDGWRWLVDATQWQLEEDCLTWTCPGDTDLWRITEGVASKHDGPAFAVRVEGDFRIEARFEANLERPYDQVGFLVQSSELRWLKAGTELDGHLWLSAVHTNNEADWSREAFPGLPLELAIERRADSVYCYVREDGEWRSFRVLYLPGPVDVGAYSCAPKGDGFEASMRLRLLKTDD